MKIGFCVVILAAVSAMTVPLATGQSTQPQEGQTPPVN